MTRFGSLLVGFGILAPTVLLPLAASAQDYGRAYDYDRYGRSYDQDYDYPGRRYRRYDDDRYERGDRRWRYEDRYDGRRYRHDRDDD